jgi:hypothetical protein
MSTLGAETSSARSLFATDGVANFQGDFGMTAYAIFIRERSRNAAELQIYAELVTPLLGESGAKKAEDVPARIRGHSG